MAFTGIDQERTPKDQTIVELAESSDSLSTFAKAIKQADLQATLNSEGPYTVFAPTDEAFADLPDGTMEYLMKAENQDKLARILKYHVVKQEVETTELDDGESIATLQGDKIEVSAKEETKIDDAEVLKSDVEASNGVVHVIDEVIMPDLKKEKKK